VPATADGNTIYALNPTSGTTGHQVRRVSHDHLAPAGAALPPVPPPGPGRSARLAAGTGMASCTALGLV
jgi:hypothetical protein